MTVAGNTRRKLLLYGTIAIITTGAFAAATALLVNIFERKQEARNATNIMAEVHEDTIDPAVWGKNWPRQYDGYLRTSEPTRTKYGGGVGSESNLPPQKSEKDPWLKRIFAGYLFAIDYRDRRGHAFMLQDQEITKRNVPAEGRQSGNCLHCHSSVTPLYRTKGKEALPNGTEAEQLAKGMEVVGAMSYWDAHHALGQLTTVDGKNGTPHPVSCVDCHSPKNMQLRASRPAFIEGLQKLAASDVAVPHLPSIEQWRRTDRSKPYDPNLLATRQEMRSYTCAQCHVEYFCGKGTTIFFPWEKGLKVEHIEAAFNSRTTADGKRFKDWVHAETGMDMLKAQHPEFEVWSQGVHARSGVACADCHMPYKREGATKVTEHWVKSPLLMVNRSCQTCHAIAEDELKARVEQIQDRHHKLMSQAGQANADMIDAIVAVRKLKTSAFADDPNVTAQQKLEKWRAMVTADPALKELEELQRAAQWRLDYVAAENSMGFHAPQELARILGESIDYARQAQVKAVQQAKP